MCIEQWPTKLCMPYTREQLTISASTAPAAMDALCTHQWVTFTSVDMKRGTCFYVCSTVYVCMYTLHGVGFIRTAAK